MHQNIITLLMHKRVQKFAFYKFGIKVHMAVNNEINEGTCHRIMAWWEANRKSRHLNQRFYDMQSHS